MESDLPQPNKLNFVTGKSLGNPGTNSASFSCIYKAKGNQKIYRTDSFPRTRHLGSIPGHSSLQCWPTCSNPNKTSRGNIGHTGVCIDNWIMEDIKKNLLSMLTSN